MSSVMRGFLVVLCTLGWACSDSAEPSAPEGSEEPIEIGDEPVASDGGVSPGDPGALPPHEQDGGRPHAGDSGSGGADAGDGGGDPDPVTPPDVVEPQPLDQGEPCTPDGTLCADGLTCEAASGRCCPPDQHCCEIASDCPASYRDERGCVDARRCRGSVEIARCADHVCASAFVASSTDASGCAGLECTALACSDGVLDLAGACDGAGVCVQPAQDLLDCSGALGCGDDGCATQCVPGTHQGCRSYHTCSEDGTTCTPDANEGADCSQAAGGPSVCLANATCNPVNQRCCIDGMCCTTAADCAASDGDDVYEGAVCSEAASCAGERREKQCVANRCDYSATPEAAACDGQVCATGVCGAGQCVGRGKGEPCASAEECWSKECRKTDLNQPGVCGAGVGERCGLGGFDCAEGTLCWNGDPVGQTGRCIPKSCEGRVCSYWQGGRDGACDGVVAQFVAAMPGAVGVVCYDDQTQHGTTAHEIACSNVLDDDGDALADAADPDCMTPNRFWLEGTDRAAGARCQWPSCGAGESGAVVQCSSGVGGCYDAECHSTICFPDAGGCAGLTPAQGICKWWHAPRDADQSCGANELLDRPEGSHCGAGCSCRAGMAEEFLCGDDRDNDFDGLIDADDADCMRAVGQRCEPARWNGAPDPGDHQRRISGFVGDEDQCAGADVCWCADVNCTRGVCLDDQASCVTSLEFFCNAYPNASATGCGTPARRPDGVAAYPPIPGLTACQAGVAAPLGIKQPGEACSVWHECASAQCSCGNADCSARVCWAAGDCTGNLCQYRVDATTCRSTVVGATPITCGGGDLMGIDLRQQCACQADAAGNARMAEMACDDGINNDWPQLHGGSADATSDWLDGDCLGDIEGYSPWYLSTFFRFNLP